MTRLSMKIIKSNPLLKFQRKSKLRMKFQEAVESIQEPTVAEKLVHSTEVEATGEMSDEIDTEFERLLLEMEGARFSSERKALMEKQTSEFLVTLKIDKMERTLLGDPKYRGGQSVHGLLDGGPYIGVVKVPVELDEKILSFKEGDEIQLWASLSRLFTESKTTCIRIK